MSDQFYYKPITNPVNQFSIIVVFQFTTGVVISISTGLRKYLNNTSWLLVQNTFNILSSLFIGALVARYLGPSDYGLLNYAISYAFIFNSFATLGLDQIVIRELVKSDCKKNDILGTAFGLKFIGAMVVLLLLAFSSFFVVNDIYTRVLILIVGLSTVLQSFNVIDFYFQSIVKSKFVVFSNIVKLGVSGSLKITGIVFQFDLPFFIVILVIDSIVLVSGFVFFYTVQKQSILSWRFRPSYAKFLLKNSWTVMLAAIFISIYLRIDQILIVEFLDSAQLGIYAAAVKLGESWYFVPTAICASVYPAIVGIKDINYEKYQKRVQHLFDLMVWMSVGVGTATLILGPLAIKLLFGESYLNAAPVLSVHIWAGLFISLGIARGKWIFAENLQRIYPIFTAGGMITNIALNVILIPRYGIIGAAIATLVAQSVSALFIPLILKETRPSAYLSLKSFNIVRVIRDFMIYLRMYIINLRRPSN